MEGTHGNRTAPSSTALGHVTAIVARVAIVCALLLLWVAWATLPSQRDTMRILGVLRAAAPFPEAHLDTGDVVFVDSSLDSSSIYHAMVVVVAQPFGQRFAVDMTSVGQRVQPLAQALRQSKKTPLVCTPPSPSRRPTLAEARARIRSMHDTQFSVGAFMPYISRRLSDELGFPDYPLFHIGKGCNNMSCVEFSLSVAGVLQEVRAQTGNPPILLPVDVICNPCTQSMCRPRRVVLE